MPPPSATFPVVSFAPFLHGSGSEQRAVAQQLYDAFHTYGWVYLKDFGISDGEVAAMFAASKAYFAQPLSHKQQDALLDPSINQGYTADGAEAGSSRGRDHKECFEYRRFHNPNMASASFAPTLASFYAKCLDLSLAVLRALALSIGLAPTFFDAPLARADPQLRLLHYMPVPPRLAAGLDAGHARIHPHTDFGLCTLLFQDAVGGLEVDPFHTGAFVPATPLPGTVVVNVADLLQRWTNDRLRSTRHRVTAPTTLSGVEQQQQQGESGGAVDAETGERLLPARYSIAFFVHPSADTEVKPILMSEDEESKYEPVNAGEWRTSITAANYSLPIAAS